MSDQDHIPNFNRVLKRIAKEVSITTTNNNLLKPLISRGDPVTLNFHYSSLVGHLSDCLFISIDSVFILKLTTPNNLKNLKTF